AAALHLVRIELGYPETGIDYAPLGIVRGDAFGNLQRVEAFNRREMAELFRPINPDERAVQLHPQMIGAILHISPNSVDFAAGLLQPPYFDPAGGRPPTVVRPVPASPGRTRAFKSGD